MDLAFLSKDVRRETPRAEHGKMLRAVLSTHTASSRLDRYQLSRSDEANRPIGFTSRSFSMVDEETSWSRARAHVLTSIDYSKMPPT
jgi:hypothetical protein